jgi:hypothetical protein
MNTERRNLAGMKDVPKAFEAVWKIESTRLIAAIARIDSRERRAPGH